MATLRIEHPIRDLETWLGAFGQFAEARQKGGVLTHRIYQSVEDDHYILIDLDFEAIEQAERFRTFLEEKVWSSATASPGLAGRPQARVLISVETPGRAVSSDQEGPAIA